MNTPRTSQPPAPSVFRLRPHLYRCFGTALALIALMVGATHSATAAEPELPYAPDSLLSSEHVIDPSKPPAAWERLLRELQGKQNITAKFTENRYLPFKKIPVVFTGEMRLSKERGLSLRYTEPEQRTMIVDHRGVLLRDDSGRTRELPADPRAQAATAALLHIMRFDLHALSENFQVYAMGDERLWHFAFEPKDEGVAKTLSRLYVSGEKAVVRRIVMRKSAMQRVEILVRDVQEGVSFNSEEIQRHFR